MHVLRMHVLYLVVSCKKSFTKRVVFVYWLPLKFGVFILVTEMYIYSITVILKPYCQWNRFSLNSLLVPFVCCFTR